MSRAYTLKEIDKIGSLPPGTQIAVRSSFQNLHQPLRFFYSIFNPEKYYYHHGIYLGNSSVIYFSGEDKKDAKPRRCDILEFVQSSDELKLYTVEHANETLVAEETLKRAEEASKNVNSWPEYRLVDSNGESFANWLKTGKSWSTEGTAAVEKVICLGASPTKWWKPKPFV